jgi:hypothetical protein
VFNGLNLESVPTDSRTKFRSDQMVNRCGQRGSSMSITIDKDDAGISWSGSNGQRDRLAGMKADSSAAYGICDGLLQSH